ncbi:helix-turn-helix domain-containing protein [Allorhizocola rhizosphaerae]|uniref:helix-turn-helix domain-containing protein n=1 Tax=Allorhizocola rhizosphaerae TaxID=1872709 RepID=UPI000E3BB996|nr:helix-turn-helix transcriptional regulator [Allorhizocola rhizosphaerae]
MGPGRGETQRVETLRRDLAHAMRTGPFSAVLHLAIEASRLRLEEIQERLGAQGISVSLTTLSYWRRGRSRPERPESLKAVRSLEDILGLPADSLIAQLGPRRPRGRWLSHPPGTIDIDRLFQDSVSVAKMLDELDNRMHHELTRLSLHDMYFVGPQRQETNLTVRQVLRANVDRVSRAVAVFRTDDPTHPHLRINAVRNCRVGRVRSDVDGGLLAAELVFDRVLSQGETVVVEYEFISKSVEPTDIYFRGFAAPVGEYVLLVQFDANAVPARCFRFERRGVSAPDQGVREVWIGNTHGAHLVAYDVPPGIVGMRWEWE